MTDVQSRLIEFAKSSCLPYLLRLPGVAPHIDRIAFILVGSVATGLCRKDSDVDIALVCDNDIYKAISVGYEWNKGRPSEARIEDIQLHYYGIRLDEIKTRLRELDDVYLYVYSNTIVLQDTGNRYTRSLGGFLSSVPEIRGKRIEGKLDMLLRRSRALQHCLAERDILTIGKVCLELITICLKLTALLDDVPFDPRKRLFKTAMSGKLGQCLQERVRDIFSGLGNLGQLKTDSDFVSFELPDKFKDIIRLLSQETRTQGFCVGLEKPDRRHMEK